MDQQDTPAPARIVSLGTVVQQTHGVKDLLTDNHNGTWKRLKADRSANPRDCMVAAQLIDG